MSESPELLPGQAFQQWKEARKALGHAIQHYLDSTTALLSDSHNDNHPAEEACIRTSLSVSWPDDSPAPETPSKRARAQAHLSQVFNSFQVVNTLPFEVLLKIFRFSALHTHHTQYGPPTPFSYQENDYQCLLALTHVCSYWRTILLNEPYFWSRFIVDPQYPLEHEYERAKVYLDRARDLPRSLLIYDHPDHRFLYLRHFRVFSKIIDSWGANLTQLALLNFRAIHLAVDTIMFWLNNGKPGVLRELSIHMGDDIIHHTRIYTGNSYQRSEVMLGPIRVLSLRGTIFAWDSPVYRNLVVLSLGDAAISPTINELLRILSGCPQLHTLRLFGMPIKSSDPISPKSICLPELENLNLASLPPESIRLLLPKISTGYKGLSLRMAFSSWDAQDFSEFYHFLARTNVTRLFIRQCGGLESGSVLSRCLSPLPNLHTLILDLDLEPGDSFLSGLTYFDESTSKYTPRCPQLHTLYFLRGSATIGAIQQIVETHPLIRKLSFSACYVEPFEDVLRHWLDPFVKNVKFNPQFDEAMIFDWYHTMT